MIQKFLIPSLNSTYLATDLPSNFSTMQMYGVDRIGSIVEGCIFENSDPSSGIYDFGFFSSNSSVVNFYMASDSIRWRC